MLCKKVIPLLSEYFDEALDPDITVQISQHLDQCLTCRKEYKSLSELHGALKSLGKVQAPEYLHKLVHHRVSAVERNAWRIRVQNDVERRWSKIQTVDGTWYATRILGTALACILFFVIASSMSPFITSNAASSDRSTLVPTDYFEQFVLNVLSTFGLISKQSLESTADQRLKSDAAINDGYLQGFGQSVSQAGEDDSFFVLADVDEKGSAKIRSVLESPQDENLLSSFNEMILAARCRPAVKNGQTVPSYLIFLFNKVSVYN